MFEFYFAQSKQCLDYCCGNKSERKESILELFYEEINEGIIQTKDMTREVFFLSLLRTSM